ncbi:hypothetical protein [Microcoleus sp. PH2017_22_RUC_O_B]|uniref:hypothetical protein n=1 Tax=unclassified Microcoleus TaxID=2642155 RepID=UPI003454D597
MIADSPERRKKEEGRRKKEEGRRKKEEGRRKKEDFFLFFFYFWSFITDNQNP